MRVGLDFGTTNTTAAVYDGGKVELIPLDPVAASPRRRELERELAAYSTPDQRCDLEATLDRYPDSATGELREILSRQAATASPSAVSSPYG